MYIQCSYSYQTPASNIEIYHYASRTTSLACTPSPITLLCERGLHGSSLNGLFIIGTHYKKAYYLLFPPVPCCQSSSSPLLHTGPLQWLGQCTFLGTHLGDRTVIHRDRDMERDMERGGGRQGHSQCGQMQKER